MNDAATSSSSAAHHRRKTTPRHGLVSFSALRVVCACKVQPAALYAEFRRFFFRFFFLFNKTIADAAEMDADFLLPKQGLAALAIDGTPDPESVAYRCSCVFYAFLALIVCLHTQCSKTVHSTSPSVCVCSHDQPKRMANESTCRSNSGSTLG